jgi:type I restriction enzyme M protein
MDPELRRTLVEDHFPEGAMSLPNGVFRMTADGWSLDDKRYTLLPLPKLGPNPKQALEESDHEKNNLPDCLNRWIHRRDSARERERTAQSFCVPKEDIASQGYDLSLNRAKGLVREEIQR